MEGPRYILVLEDDYARLLRDAMRTYKLKAKKGSHRKLTKKELADIENEVTQRLMTISIASRALLNDFVTKSVQAALPPQAAPPAITPEPEAGKGKEEASEARIPWAEEIPPARERYEGPRGLGWADSDSRAQEFPEMTPLRLMPDN